ncbi:MAG: (deoxy)nucleoside triphosphate pyrophosphohydrolase [Candidatus Woesearchaeota archaeon]|nr:(deoxy)nucleoside triphosphate pyrophosphohydrolase [Candidatus Woesearchaeota archaeon]
MEQPILVTAAIIKKNNKYLITQRPNDGRHKGSFWEFPGGKLKVGENPRAALEREILEELGIKIKAGEIFEISSHIYDKIKHIILLGFYCEYISGDIQNYTRATNYTKPFFLLIKTFLYYYKVNFDNGLVV